MPPPPKPSHASVPLITSLQEADALYDDIRRAGIFGLDTEFISENTYRPQLALAQIATPDRIAILDPLALPHLDPLWELATDPSITLIMHAGEQESRFCWYDTGRLPTNVFDVQLAAGLVGHRYPLAYHTLVRSVLNGRAEQGQTRTDWMRRPLTAPQLAYAAADVQLAQPGTRPARRPTPG